MGKPGGARGSRVRGHLPGWWGPLAGALAFGSFGAVLGWWQLTLLPDPAMTRLQHHLVIGLAALAVLAFPLGVPRRGKRSWPHRVAREVLLDRHRRLAAGLGAAVVLVLAVALGLGGRVENSDWPVLLAVGVAAGLWGARGALPVCVPLAVFTAACLLLAPDAGRLPLAALGAGILALVLVTAWWLLAPPPAVTRGFTVVLVLVPAVVTALAPAPVVAQRDARPLDLEIREIIPGRGDRPAFFFPQHLAVSADGVAAIVDRRTTGRDALWLLEQDAARLVSTDSPALSTPAGVALFEAPEYSSDDGDSGAAPAASFVAAEPEWLRTLQDWVSADEAAPIYGSLDIAFGAGGDLYGLTTDGLWSLPDGADRPQVVVDEFPEDVHLERLAGGAFGEPLVAQGWLEDGDDWWWAVFAVDAFTGAVTEIQLRDPEGEPLGGQTSSEQQDGLVGLAGDGSGGYYTLAGSDLVRFTLDGDHEVVASLPSSGRLVSDIAYGQGRLVLSYEGDAAGVELIDVAPDGGAPVVSSVLRSGQVPDQGTCVPVATSALVTGASAYLRVPAVSSDGTVYVLAPPSAGCLPTLWRLPPGQGEWLPVTTPSQQDYAVDFELEQDVVGPVWSPWVSARGTTGWVAPALNALVFRLADGRSGVVRFPRNDTVHVTPPHAIVAAALGDDWWLIANATSDLGGTDVWGTTILRAPAGGYWEAVLRLDGARDVAVAPGGDVLIARCGQVLGISASWHSIVQPIEEFWWSVAGAPAPSAGDAACPQVGQAGVADLASADGVVISPAALAAIPAPAALTEVSSPGASGTEPPAPSYLVYVADVNTTDDGRTPVARIRVIGEEPRTGRRLVETLPGGDLGDLGLVPVDLAVDPTGRVCAATQSVAGPGPLVLLADGRRRIVSLAGRQLTGCAWSGEDLVVTDVASGDVLTLAVPAEVLSSEGPFVPGSGQ